MRSRTLENFPTPNSRALANDTADADAQDSADEDKLTTPKREKTEPEELGSAGRYPTRMCPSLSFSFSTPPFIVVQPHSPLGLTNIRDLSCRPTQTRPKTHPNLSTRYPSRKSPNHACHRFPFYPKRPSATSAQWRLGGSQTPCIRLV